jgi:uncharacterized protein YnzC (UPF0291/DUF896 family)
LSIIILNNLVIDKEKIMDQLKILRINELSKKSKGIGLTAEEKQEQQELRQEYIKAFRSDLKLTLDSVKFKDKN